MKIIKLLSLLCISLAISACGNMVSVEKREVTPQNANFKNLKVFSLNDSARKAIGATDENDLIIIFTADKQDGAVKIITSDKFKFRNGNNRQVMQQAKKYRSKKPKLIVEGKVRVTSNSPFCFEYEDSRGNTGWWPVPDCPHN